jgi:MazG family protein
MERLLGLMARLRAPDGCPWDREQTPATLKPQMLEECYEVIEAIDAGSPGHLTEELGDLLLHIVFQAQIAREAGDFTFADVANGIADKLVRRHPHVFGDGKVADAAGVVVTLWHELKKAEKPERESALDGVPRALPGPDARGGPAKEGAPGRLRLARRPRLARQGARGSGRGDGGNRVRSRVCPRQ